jgi:hypothetical protein
LEVEFNLCRLVPGFTIKDIREKLTSREIDWFFSRLVKQLQDDENKVNGNTGFSGVNRIGGKTF